jgi:membrane protein YqaA with SNARE-associated domain
MNEWLKWGSVLGTSVLELWAAIPLGFALDLHPIMIALLSAIGSIISAAIVILFGKSLRSWLMKRWERKEKKQGRLSRIWNQYGVIGLGLVSPLLTGAPLGAAIGLSFGARPGKLLIWMTVGIIVWSIILTGAVAIGILSLTSFK